MAIPGFFKQNKPRGFNYVPRYYDPVKEEMEERRRAQGTGHRAKGEGTDRQRSVSGPGQEVQSAEDRAQAVGTERRAHKEQSDAVPQQRESSGHGARGTVYRSRIMRGDMKNHFHRRNERVQKYTMIRILVIAMIITLVIYLYLRF